MRRRDVHVLFPGRVAAERSVIDPAEIEDIDDAWHHAGFVAEMAVWNAANRAKDRHDEELDAMRVHNGMTLDEFLASK